MNAYAILDARYFKTARFVIGLICRAATNEQFGMIQLLFFLSG